MFLKDIARREFGFSECIEDIFKEKSLSKLRCHYRNVYSCTSKSYESNGLEVPPFIAKFSPYVANKTILLVASEEGEIFVHDQFDDICDRPSFKINAHDNAIFDICWMEDPSRFITVSGDKTAILWNLPTKTPVSLFKGHICSIKSVDTRPSDEFVFATAGREGNIIIWDTRSTTKNQPCHLINIIRGVHNNPDFNSLKKSKCKGRSETFYGVTNVLFQDENTLISSGAVDGEIKFWDIRRSYIAYKNEPLPFKSIPYQGISKKQGFTSLTLDSSRCRLFASCTDNIIYEYNCTSGQIVTKYAGHRNSSFYVKSTLCPQNRYLLSGSNDEHAYIWKVGGDGKPIYRLNGHCDEVTSVDWSKSDDTMIVTCCDDMKYRIWRVCLDDNSQDDSCNHTSGYAEKVNNQVICKAAAYKRSNSSATETPLKEIQLNENRQFTSPTVNLPNIVLDGQNTPPNILQSSNKRIPKPSNWLTELSDSKKGKQSNNRKPVSAKKVRRKTKIGKCLENYFSFS